MPSALARAARITVCPAALPCLSQSPSPETDSVRSSPVWNCWIVTSYWRSVAATSGLMINRPISPIRIDISTGEMVDFSAERPEARTTTSSEVRESDRNSTSVDRMMKSGSIR